MGDNIARLIELQDSGKNTDTTEDAMALTFAEQHADHLRFCAAWGRWFNYDGTCWTHDATLHAFDLAREICREVAATCLKPPGAITSAKTVAAIERLAKSDRRLAATPEQWDAAADLISSNAATVDLRTGERYPPRPEDYITKCAPVAPGGDYPLWRAFLKRVTADDVDLQQYLQRVAGYCLTGHTSEHAIFFLYGTGANGKGVFVNTLVGMMGDYAITAPMEVFIESKTDRHPTELAMLRGARLVVANETQAGRHWNEARIKTLTGGDRIPARFMRGDFFEFTPQFKLIISGNHKPSLRTVDVAMRRRLHMIPFTVTIPVQERDPDLAQKLKTEWSGILQWAINGCLEWRRTGLQPPAAVRDTTESYFAEQDTLQQWLDDCIKTDPLAFARISDLFSSWKDWCEARNLRPGTSTALSDLLSSRGLDRKRESGTGQRGFAGLAIKRR